MDKRKRRGRRDRRDRRLTDFKSEKGYLLISTLFFLVFSGLFSHSMIKISGNQIMQLRQFSTAYKAKGAMNIGEELLKTYLEEENEPPERGQIRTSVGDIFIKKKSDVSYQLLLTLNNGANFSREVKVPSKRIEEPIEETEIEPNVKDDNLEETEKTLEENNREINE